MKKHFIYILAIAILVSINTPLAQAAQGSIAAVVNENIITISDVKNRSKLYLFGSQGKPSKEQLKSVEKQALERLIDEALQIEEAAKFGINIDQSSINNGLKKIAEKNKTTPEKLKLKLKNSGVNIRSLEEQIKAELAWTSVVQRKIRPKINVSEKEIDLTMNKIENDNGKTQYLLAEIMLKVPNNALKTDVRNKAQELTKKLKDEGVPFSALARQFSQAPGAASGGDLGWVKEDQFEENINKNLAKMKPGQLSKPILSSKGYHIFFLRDIRNSSAVDKESDKTRNAVAGQLGMQRMMKMAENYLRDIRSAAFIDKRI